MRPGIAAVAISLCAGAAFAENSVEDWSWAVDHFERFGIWESVCDHRDEEGETLRRCYIAHVDVFSPRPRFAAAFVFVTPHADNGLRFEFRFEPGTLFEPDGFTVRRDGRIAWKFDPARCPDLKCIVSGSEARVLADAMRKGGELRFALTDRFDRSWELSWDTDGFSQAVNDMTAAAAARSG